MAPSRIVLECGPTFSNFIEAERLVKIAAEAGAEAVKFQYINADRLVADRERTISFKVLENGHMADRSESLHAILKRRELSTTDWLELRSLARGRGLGFYCTASYEDEFEFLFNQLEVDAVKVASADIDNLPLLRWLHLNTPEGTEVHIDTGSANIWEVDRAVETLGDCVIHHVPSGYPAHLPSIHLRMISTLRMMYPEHIIGFSDHSPGWEMDIAAIALGAQLVEKTITLDRHRPEIEHCFSLEPDEVPLFIQKIRELEKALGSTRRTIPAVVLSDRRGFRRSLHLTRPVAAGEPIRGVELRRPGTGIPAQFQEVVEGREAKRDLEVGPLRWEDV